MTREFSKGGKRASVELQNGRYVAWVGYDADGKGDTIPARFFKGFSTCSNEYKTEAAAVKAVERFLAW
jgi:hypothetical protein